ncbi:phosphoserine aminotransferase apoenzyme [Thiothrix eikelboomii]|uniref:Phosphoserine aminotransferase n=1 Tax=Thiothrix eikelboomii TaxID=92487 RepID=A0A1T4XB66_9GAMM|nr:3-phosphoserine/phosphohydroxythreonine transaminase [Thiothrix eikelboomii]SKA86151.1 phosphoserine aminotransferase apoenzyme [Thiothrix eikelboomii]
MKQPVFNFSPGPAVLPHAVLEQAKAELLDWHGSGMSVMEMSHRGREFMSIAAQAEADLRTLMQIPQNYKVLFLQGGAHSQFAMIPMNLARGKSQADYLDTGDWSLKAIEEGRRYLDLNVVASSAASHYTTIPPLATWQLNPAAAYLHYTSNETIRGVEFDWIPELGDLPLVVDMSSDILSRPIEVSRFGLIYAGAQKNIGPAGLTIVIVREDLLGQVMEGTPSMFNYQLYAETESMYNTPPTYAWYLAGLVFQWLLQQGGLEAMAQINQRKASKLYAAIDQSDFYHNPVDPDCRSWMNLPFTLANPKLEQRFLDEAAQVGLVTLKGHRLVGGMRASLYNAMPEEGVDALIAFMRDFEAKHG